MFEIEISDYKYHIFVLRGTENKKRKCHIFERKKVNHIELCRNDAIIRGEEFNIKCVVNSGTIRHVERIGQLCFGIGNEIQQFYSDLIIYEKE